ncbi:DUF445 family protein [Candidatus Acetothermia bacterium]|nr:DUF445 family protein [Candidatus Acetothermia bacterium]
MDWRETISIIAISAFVGYITNWVAIRMLFRPRLAWRLWGLRVPFTPGLFPQRRKELALSLGHAIREHLLTDTAFAERLAEPELRARVRATTEKYLKELLRRDWPSLLALIPESFQPTWQQLLQTLQKQLELRVEALMAHPELELFVRTQLKTKFNESMEKPLADLVPSEFLRTIPEHAGALAARLAQDESLHRCIDQLLDERITALLSEDRSLDEFLDPKLKAAIYTKIEEHLPNFLDQFVGVLDDEQIKKRIRVHVYEMVDTALSQVFREDSLWDRIKFGFLEGYLISAEELKTRIDQSLDEAAPRLRQLVQQRAVHERVHQSLTNALENFFAQRLSELNITRETIAPLRERTTQWFAELTQQPSFQTQISQWLSGQLQTAQSKSLKELAPGLLDAAGLNDWIASQLLALLKEKKTVRALTQIAWSEFEKLLRQPLGTLERFVSTELFDKACDLATERFLELLQRELPQILQTIDLEKLIASEVDKLSVEEVEELVLRVIGHQLSAITWFGAILGGLIGLVQVIILWVK